MITIKDIVKPLPQPYKAYAARLVLVCSVPILVPLSVIVEGSAWCKEMYREYIDAWQSVREW
jgi:hypothetical protein